MKLFLKLIILSVLLIVSVPFSIFAQDGGFKINAGYSLHTSYFDTYGGTLVYGIGVDFYFTQLIGFGINAHIQKFSATHQPVSSSEFVYEITNKIIPITANFIFRISGGENYKVNPVNFSLILGGGLYLEKDSAEIQYSTFWWKYLNGGILGGLNFEYKFSDNLGLNILSRYNYIINTNTQYIDFLAGLTIFWDKP